ncbi:(d)CMP kinase [Tepidamorphus sp. 3E244]|uniref:(d)CMP kinase n=1 Tax=Tepidamorphus sp. 3E244 TaxID=3385498 RepID=UPI0038FCD502
MIIAVDGPAAAGKGTLTRRLGLHYGFDVLDTGALYRTVAAIILNEGSDPKDVDAALRAAANPDPKRFESDDLRAPGIAEAASIVAANQDVRSALLEFQRSFAAREPGAILDGRDIGTVVCPHAHVKLFVTASVEARANRRWLEMCAMGEDRSLDDVRADVLRRDERDAARAASPMCAADDAHLLDTTEMDIEAAFRAAVSIVDTARSNAR